jgi:hypothetical protein
MHLCVPYVIYLCQVEYFASRNSNQNACRWTKLGAIVEFSKELSWPILHVGFFQLANQDDEGTYGDDRDDNHRSYRKEQVSTRKIFVVCQHLDSHFGQLTFVQFNRKQSGRRARNCRLFTDLNALRVSVNQ